MQDDGCKVYMETYMASNGGQLDCFHKPPLGGGHPTKGKTVAFQMLKSVDLLYFIMCEEPR
jgi:hypothetical protein